MISSNFLEYIILLIFFIIITIISLTIIFISYITSEQKFDLEKTSAYECGFDRAPLQLNIVLYKKIK
jgi:NADH:ubiquinone oxidoreductase subunit 3 (subunit A)